MSAVKIDITLFERLHKIFLFSVKMTFKSWISEALWNREMTLNFLLFRDGPSQGVEPVEILYFLNVFFK